jgi:hypothetical protein
MNTAVLPFEPSFPQTLAREAGKILNIHLVVGEKFNSADSFSYLLESESEKFIGKIYRFKDWPPEGKIPHVFGLLDKYHIPHEEIIYAIHKHPVFTFGWQLNKFIPGGNARQLRLFGKITNEEYYKKVGLILRKIHGIPLTFFDSLEDKSEQVSSAKELIYKEIQNLSYDDLPEKYSWAKKIFNQSRKAVLAEVNMLTDSPPTLVHDDVNDANIMWNNGSPILIDWTDAHAAPAVRDFATITFREDKPILSLIEKSYGQTIDRKALRLWQMIRFIKLGHFFYFESGDVEELKKMMTRLEVLLDRNEPYGV